MAQTTERVEDKEYWNNSVTQQALLAEGIKTAAEFGIRIRGLESLNGVIKPEDQRKYTIQSRRRNKGWLNYVLANPNFFIDHIYWRKK